MVADSDTTVVKRVMGHEGGGVHGFTLMMKRKRVRANQRNPCKIAKCRVRIAYFGP